MVAKFILGCKDTKKRQMKVPFFTEKTNKSKKSIFYVKKSSIIINFAPRLKTKPYESCLYHESYLRFG